MRLFTISQTHEMLPYNEHDFKVDNFEKDLENILEKNPQYFFEESNILIVGRQIATNFNTFIDLLGIDKNGNTIIIELKRDKTPRETIAQILEYASFIENLDYKQINSIFQNYYGNEVDLEDYHREYFSKEENELDGHEIGWNDSIGVSFNKSTKLLIIAQTITKEIKQTAIYLRKFGLDIYCLEFKYFKTKSGEKIISSDFVVGEDEYKNQQVKSSSLPKVNESDFLKELDVNGKAVFQKLLDHAKHNNLTLIWGSKGFSLNVLINGENVALLFGYPPSSVYKQSIYTGFESIFKKVNNSAKIVDVFRSKLISSGLFIEAGKNMKWIINKEYSDELITDFISIIKEIAELIIKEGWTTTSSNA